MGKKQPSEQTPVYAVVHASLRTQIFTGQYRPGDLLPSESHLCQEFGASRETVRRGLQQLENEGLIFSRPKIGYFVSQPNHNDMVLSLAEELEGTELQYRDIHGILPDERLQELLDIPANRKVIEFSQISRDGEGQPVAYDVKFVPYARAYPSVESEIRYAVLPDLTFAKLSSFSVYSQITVTAVAAEGEPARALECPEGTPLLLIEHLSPAGRQPGGGTAPLQPRPTGQAYGDVGSQTMKIEKGMCRTVHTLSLIVFPEALPAGRGIRSRSRERSRGGGDGARD